MADRNKLISSHSASDTDAEAMAHFKRSVTDGKHWYFPTRWDADPVNPFASWTDQAYWPRKDLAEEIGMNIEDITTIADIEKLLRAYSELKDEEGDNIIPAGYRGRSHFEAVVLSSFGVSGKGNIPINETSTGFEFTYDSSGYKEAYIWGNKMMREGLIDPESLTQEDGLLKEKAITGKYGMIIGSFWQFRTWDTPQATKTEPMYFYRPIVAPKAEGVDTLGTTKIINPLPREAVFVSKAVSEDTEHLEAALGFLDWCLDTTNPFRQFESSNGVEGRNWYLTGGPRGEWDFTEEYNTAFRDESQKASLQPTLFMMTTYSADWYPWWDRYSDQPEDHPSGFLEKYSRFLGTQENVRVVQTYDIVKVLPDGAIDTYYPTVKSVLDEYHAKLMLAETDEEFNTEWEAFREALESRGHWTEIKEEWYETYKTAVKLEY